jgi:hypothetical protein
VADFPFVAWGQILWDEPPFSDTAWVVRGGQENTDKTLWLNANSVYRVTATVNATGVWGVCGGCHDDASPQEIALRMPYGGDWMAAARLGDLRKSGFDVVKLWDADPTCTHALVLLYGEPPADNQSEGWQRWDELRAPFGPPERIDRESE